MHTKIQYRNIYAYVIITYNMALSRSRVITYMILLILILSLILALLSRPTKEGLDVKPSSNIATKPDTDMQPKKYLAEMLQVKDDKPSVPSFGAETKEVFNPETSYYIGTASVNETKPNQKTALFKTDSPTPIVLNMETKKVESMIMVAPQEGGKFPAKFNFTLTNVVKENNLTMDLWGTSPSLENVPSNSIIGSDNYASYPYPKTLFSTKDKDGKLIDGLKIGGINIGNNALNIIGVGRIFDRNFKDIGEVLNINDTINIVCTDSSGLTGILLYLSKATTLR